MAERAQPERVLQICFGGVCLILIPFQPFKEKIFYTSFLFRKKDCKVDGMLIGSIVREIKKEGSVRC